MRTLPILLSALVLAVLAPAQARTLRVVDLRGTAHERGVAHGRALRVEIAAMLRAWERDVEQVADLDPEEFVARFLARTGFVAAAERHTPELLDEVRGIAEGAGQPFETMLVYQLVDELWAQHGVVDADKCSTIGVDRDGETPGLVAQNLDLPPWMHRHPTVLRIDDGERGPRSLVVTMPGLVGMNGLNDRRVAVGVNTILQLRARPDGLPVAFVVRGLLAQPSHGAAIAFLQRVEHACGQAYTVGGPDRSPCFEASAGGVVRWQPEGREGWRWHTNHPLASTDWSARHLASAGAGGTDPAERLRCARFDAIGRALAPGRRPTLEDVVGALSIRDPETPVCNPGTYVCTVMVLGERPELHVSPGPPHVARFEVLRFE
jgi:hypothetical protein